MELSMVSSDGICRVLSLDGGGAKGFYTLGVLRELEGSVGPLHQKFSLIFGTSTGSIIASLLALGKTVEEIHALYKDPRIMQKKSPPRSLPRSLNCQQMFLKTLGLAQ
jgi:patatin-like phospholipase/acyl hydrolase